MVVYCSMCGEEISRVHYVISASGHYLHTFDENHINPTCTEIGGYDMVTYCAVCGVEQSREHYELAPLGHQYGEWYQTQAPTEVAQGEKRRDCIDCGAFETTPIAMLGHDHNNWDKITLEAVAPTCTTFGLTAGVKCSGCGKILIAQEIVPALGHDMGEWYQTVAPACTTEGENRRDCGRGCGYYETEVVSANGHAPADAVEEDHVDPTCTEIGGYDMAVYCTVCGEELSREHTEIAALGHTEGEIVVENNVDPTCTETGSYDNVVYCTVCGEELSREHYDVEATGHSHNVVVTAPTCTEQGYTTYTCHCGDTFVDSYVDALGHTEAIDESVAPTCTSTGLTEGSHCSVCNEILVAQEVVPANGHTYESVVTDPTCTEKGYATHTCHCGDSYVDSEVDALGHTSSDWIVDAEAQIGVEGSKHKECTVCGETLETEVIDALTEAPTTEAPATEAPTTEAPSTEPSGGCSGTISASVALLALLSCFAVAWRPCKDN